MTFRMQARLPDIKIEQFEGPYDLLVELAKKQQVSLSEISLLSITDSFIAYMQEHTMPTETLASFLVVASTLLLIKARQALPHLKSEEEEEINTLEEHLKLYEQYRKAAEELFEQWGRSRLLPANFFAEGEIQHVQDFSSMKHIHPQELSDILQGTIEALPSAAKSPPYPAGALTLRITHPL
jgi:chromatin segregation and condensation protein Rec8/ScpA/Scc1 (kleisin family)